MSPPPQLVVAVPVTRQVKFNARRRRLANNFKLNFIRNHPTPKNLTNKSNINAFRQKRNLNAWKWALKQAMAVNLPNLAGSSSGRTVGGATKGGKKVAGGVRAMFSGKGKGRGYKPTNRSTR